MCCFLDETGQDLLGDTLISVRILVPAAKPLGSSHRKAIISVAVQAFKLRLSSSLRQFQDHLMQNPVAGRRGQFATHRMLPHRFNPHRPRPLPDYNSYDFNDGLDGRVVAFPHYGMHDNNDVSNGIGTRSLPTTVLGNVPTVVQDELH